MRNEESTNTWLFPKTINCPQCDEVLYRVDHSPFADNHHLYCDSCSNSVEVSFYDPKYKQIHNGLSVNKKVDYHELMLEVEKQLSHCNCGGCFRHDSSRRCHYCLFEVIADEPGVNLWPDYYNVDEEDEELFEKTVEKYTPIVAEFEKVHIRREDIWKNEK